VDPLLLTDLRAEYATLDALVEAHDESQWRAPTPAEGWSVADTIGHLWVSECAATASVRDDRDPLTNGHESREIFGRDELLVAWRDAREATLAAFSDLDDRDRVPWGGRRMAARSLATARLMETWAHGLDCFAAFDVAAVDTARLGHVAWLGWKTLPHAFAVAGIVPVAPPTSLRVDLVAPDGTSAWSYGPSEARDLVRGPAGDWCRVVTHRLRAPQQPRLAARGALGRQALSVARAFL
jgi:uncharacterized protein (TIGR03084 family)